MPVGNKATVGCYRAGEPGLGLHADHSYQGGTHSLLAYVDSPDEGGETVFSGRRHPGLWVGAPTVVAPTPGSAIVFDVLDEHEARPVLCGVKRIVGCEIRISFDRGVR